MTLTGTNRSTRRTICYSATTKKIYWWGSVALRECDGPRGASARRSATTRGCQEELKPTQRMGKPVVCGSHHPGYPVGARKATDPFSDLRVDGPERALFQG